MVRGGRAHEMNLLKLNLHANIHICIYFNKTYTLHRLHTTVRADKVDLDPPSPMKTHCLGLLQLHVHACAFNAEKIYMYLNAGSDGISNVQFNLKSGTPVVNKISYLADS